METVSEWLNPSEREIFLAQDSRDQRHGFNAGSFVASLLPADPAAIKAAALHDIGKRHANLGALGRSVASILIKLGLPLTRRMSMYRDHGDIGAADLAAIGSDDIVVSFTRSHHHECPAEFDPSLWKLLQEADH